MDLTPRSCEHSFYNLFTYTTIKLSNVIIIRLYYKLVPYYGDGVLLRTCLTVGGVRSMYSQWPLVKRLTYVHFESHITLG